MNKKEKEIQRSLILNSFSRLIEWSSKWFTLSKWVFKDDKSIFMKVELLILGVTLFCIATPFFIGKLPPLVAIVLAFLLVQRLIEFFTVYSRNFILHRGRIYSHFHSEDVRGQWLLIMFSLNVLQLIFVFATWYHLLSLKNPEAFNQTLSVFDSLYFAIVTFVMVGYGDIVPIAASAKWLVIVENIVTFYTLVIVINGLTSMHFSRR